MQLTCSKCERAIEFSGEPPSFCAYCGKPLVDTRITAATVDPGAITAVSPTKPGVDKDTLPETIGNFRIVRQIGAGGMGTVYEAEDPSGRRVALKVIAKEYAGSPDAVERFRQEGRLASMVTHPRCVFVLSVDEYGGRPYIVMELMPGDTLQDLVRRKGPLPVDQAIAKMLDVIEGLQAAHKLEVMHRDVKPSNCFLEADGRVKIGDFGLAKSLVFEGRLTRTGAFVGTPYFASPEQLRGDPVDWRTDIYSAAATLYYLLTGKAPFEGGDPAATLARIVSEPPPSVRRLRPDVPAALDHVLRRGLETDPDKRWPDLDSFREALVSLQPAPLTRDALGRRALAAVFDALLLVLAGVLLSWLCTRLLMPPLPTRSQEILIRLFGQGVTFLIAVFYFAITEHVGGCSPGKRLLRLRVCGQRSDDPPAAGPALRRSLTYCLLLGFGPIAASLVLWATADAQLTRGEWEETISRLGWFIPAVWLVAGDILIVAPMRRGNGYRGLHELVSGTRVVQLPWPRPVQRLVTTGPWLLYFLATRRLDEQVPQRQNFPERVGGFAIRGVLKWTAGHKVLVGEDPSLGRRVFLWLRPLAEPPLDAPRRDVGRRTRLRWLGAGRLGDWQWDALLAPLGCPVPELIRTEGPFPWEEAKPMLLELAGELAAACQDGTLPKPLSAGMAWVLPDGRAQLVDFPLMEPPGQGETVASAEERSLGLLREVATLVLEGKPPPAPIRASLPASARSILDRLLTARPGFGSVQDFAAALRITQD